jgi:hypothetical protein
MCWSKCCKAACRVHEALRTTPGVALGAADRVWPIGDLLNATLAIEPMEAILFWDRFEGRWLRGTEFHYPERPENLPALKPLENWPKSNPRDLR